MSNVSFNGKLPEPRNKYACINPYKVNDFSEIVWMLVTNNGRFNDAEYAYKYNDNLIHVFNTNNYKDFSFDWDNAKLFSLDKITPFEVVTGLEEGQVVVLKSIIDTMKTPV